MTFQTSLESDPSKTDSQPTVWSGKWLDRCGDKQKLLDAWTRRQDYLSTSQRDHVQALESSRDTTKHLLESVPHGRMEGKFKSDAMNEWVQEYASKWFTKMILDQNLPTQHVERELQSADEALPAEYQMGKATSYQRSILAELPTPVPHSHLNPSFWANLTEAEQQKAAKDAGPAWGSVYTKVHHRTGEEITVRVNPANPRIDVEDWIQLSKRYHTQPASNLSAMWRRD